MKFLKLNEKGALPLLILVAVVGLVLFLLVANLAGFKDKFFASLFPKPASHASGIVDLSLIPSQIAVSKDQTFTVDIRMDAKDKQVTAAELKVTFDRTKLQATNVQRGTFLPQAFPAPAGRTTIGPDDIVLSLGAAYTVDETGVNITPVSGAGTLATITFKALDNTSAPSVVAFDADGTNVVEYQGNCVTQPDNTPDDPNDNPIVCDDISGNLSSANVTIGTVNPTASDAYFELSPVEPNPNVGETFSVLIMANTNTDRANLFDAKLTFDPSKMEVIRIETGENSFVTQWAERVFDNSLGKVSIVGGVPDPGYKNLSAPVPYARLYMTAKSGGTSNISFDGTSAIYRNTDNVNIIRSNLSPITVTIAGSSVTPTPTPCVCPSTTPTPPAPTPTPPGQTPFPTPTAPGGTPFPTPTATPGTGDCSISNAIWKNTSNPVEAGVTVPIEVTTSGTGCDGKSVSFQVFEDDGLLGQDAVTTSPVSATVSNGKATTAWISEYQPDGFGGIGDPPEYIFRATLQGASAAVTSSDPKLQVNKPSGTVIRQGDINKDGVVNLQDLSVMLSNWNKTNDLLDEIDQNDDGVVNAFDFSLMLVTLRAAGVLSPQ